MMMMMMVLETGRKWKYNRENLRTGTIVLSKLEGVLFCYIRNIRDERAGAHEALS